MELIPLLRFWRDVRAGMLAGAVVAVGRAADLDRPPSGRFARVPETVTTR